MKIIILKLSGYVGVQRELEEILAEQGHTALKVESNLPENYIATYEVTSVDPTPRWQQFQENFQRMLVLE